MKDPFPFTLLYFALLMLDREFAGREGWRDRKGGPAMEAAGGMIREWLARSSHTPAR